MNRIIYAKIKKYIGTDDIAYIITKKQKCFPDSLFRTNVISAVESLDDNLFVRVNICPCCDGYTIQRPQQNKNNAYIVSHDVLETICKKCVVSRDRLFLDKVVLIEDFRKRTEKHEKIEARKNIKRKIQKVTNANKKTPIELVDWALKNRKKVCSTEYEDLLFEALHKTFNKNIIRQQPFIIKGNLYYADICLPTKNIIIEVDGGYHNTEEQRIKDKQRDLAFQSIGYTTIRCANNDTKNKNFVRVVLKQIFELSKTK